MLSETIFITIFLIAFYYLYKWYEAGFEINKYFILTNIFFTLTLYSKGTLSILPPLLITLFYFCNKLNIKVSIKIFIYSSIIYILIMSVWWIRNYTVFDKFVPFTTSSAMNLYLGANKNNKNGGVDWSKDIEPSFVKDTNKIKDELRKNSVYKDQAMKYIKNNPEQYIRLMFLKFKRFYNFTFNADSFNSVYYNILSILSYGTMIIFSIICFYLSRKNWKTLAPIYIVIAYFTLIHVLYIASLRYRLPLEPLFIIMASFSIILFKNKIIKDK